MSFKEGLKKEINPVVAGVVGGFVIAAPHLKEVVTPELLVKMTVSLLADVVVVTLVQGVVDIYQAAVQVRQNTKEILDLLVIQDQQKDE